MPVCVGLITLAAYFVIPDNNKGSIIVIGLMLVLH